MAEQVGADVHSGPGYMEINFPPPPGRGSGTLARSATSTSRAPAPLVARDMSSLASNLAESIGGAAASNGHGGSGGSGGGGKDGDGVVDAVLRQMRLDNEHMGQLDGFQPFF
jgi:hypothetical protein